MDYDYADADDIYVYWKQSDMLRRKYNSRHPNSHFDTFVQGKLSDQILYNALDLINKYHHCFNQNYMDKQFLQTEFSKKCSTQ